MWETFLAAERERHTSRGSSSFVFFQLQSCKLLVKLLWKQSCWTWNSVFSMSAPWEDLVRSSGCFRQWQQCSHIYRLFDRCLDSACILAAIFRSLHSLAKVSCIRLNERELNNFFKYNKDKINKLINKCEESSAECSCLGADLLHINTFLKQLRLYWWAGFKD